MENGILNWSGRGGAEVIRTTEDKHGGSGSALVSNRSAAWHGATFNVQLTPGNAYDVSVWVKLTAEQPETVIKLTGKLVDDSDPETYLEYTEIATATVNSSEWAQLSGTYVPQGTFESFIIETFDEGQEVSFYADDFVVYGEVSDPGTDPEEPTGEGLATLVNFPVGVAVSVSGGSNFLSSSPRQNIVKHEFSQISAENQMKMSYYNETDFSNTLADQMIAWAQENGLSVHGHALVWHPDYQLPSWAKTPGSDFKTKFINHVQSVATKHKGQVLSWDVVNEALFDPADNTTGQSTPPVTEYYRHSVFYTQYNGPEYIVEAFKAARAADPDALLYYNDFNTEENGNKTDGLVNLITYLLQEDAPIDGVGFQMHVLPDWPSITNIKAAWQKILDLDPNLKIKLTEIDVRTNNPYATPPRISQSCDNSCLNAQKQRYKEIIKAYMDTVPANRRGGITVWGIADSDSWYSSTTHNGQTVPDWPLLWNGSLQKKPAYEGVKEALQGL